jgi:hypothetical protein
MFDRDSYWLDRLCALITESPGINLAQLAKRSKKLTTQERVKYVEQLIAAGRVGFHTTYRRNGSPVHFLSPMPQLARPAGKPADRIAAQLARARQLVADATAAIDEAVRLASELSPAGSSTPVESAVPTTAA